MATQYATATDLASLTVTAATLTSMSISTADQNAALLAASEEADSYLRQRYTVPLTSYGQDLLQAVCDIAAFRLMTRAGYTAQGGDRTLLDGYDRAIKWLMRVSRAEVTPSLEAGVAPAGFVVSSTAKRGW